jgi:GNAT superfamily N-acetyltransferase
MTVKLAETDADIARVYPVLRQLRPHIATEAEFLATIRRLQSTQPGWRLIYAESDGVPVAASGFRIMETTAWGRILYVDDLVTLESQRSKGFGEILIRWLEDFARAEGCVQLHLDSGTQRQGAHRFYHRMGLPITSFHFARKL